MKYFSNLLSSLPQNLNLCCGVRGPNQDWMLVENGKHISVEDDLKLLNNLNNRTFKITLYFLSDIFRSHCRFIKWKAMVMLLNLALVVICTVSPLLLPVWLFSWWCPMTSLKICCCFGWLHSQIADTFYYA